MIPQPKPNSQPCSQPRSLPCSLTMLAQVAGWCGPKPRVLVINRVDEISEADRAAWSTHYKDAGQKVFWTDGKLGQGVKRLKQHLISEVGQAINERRTKRGLQPRPVRACVIGFPNIGKSALINRLLARRVVASAPKPGVTRSLRWVRLDEGLELLDAPGVIPMSFRDQVGAHGVAWRGMTWMDCCSMHGTSDAVARACGSAMPAWSGGGTCDAQIPTVH